MTVEVDWDDLSTAPLHTLAPGMDPAIQWWACEHPERKPDGNANVDLRCRACALASYAFAKSLAANEITSLFTGEQKYAGDASAAESLDLAREALLRLHGIEVPE